MTEPRYHATLVRDAAAQGLLPALPGHLIGGRWLPSSNRAILGDSAPASGELLMDFAAGGKPEIDAAVAAGHAALSGPWGRATPGERHAALKRLAALVHEQRAKLAQLEALDTGKPISEALDGDIPRAAANLEFFADLALHEPELLHRGRDGSTHHSVREPLGVVGMITPWNLPLYLASWKLAPALACGNAVVLKPAELTPLTAMALGRLSQLAGIPDGVINIVQGLGGDSGAGEGAGAALVRHPEVKALSFTGETRTGEAIMRDAAPHLKKLSFELGGKGVSIILDDADIDLACTLAARAAFRNQGQICLAGSRLLVAAKLADEVQERISKAIRSIKLGDPLDPTTSMGSLISKEHRERVDTFVQLARQGAAGAGQVQIGGAYAEEWPRGAYYQPTLITGVQQSSRLIQEEIFGPVLTLQTFNDDDEALAMANGTPYGLSCSIYTQSSARAARMAAGVRFGLVWINSWFLRDLHMAFGGMKRSGIGREGGRYSMDFYSELKTITYPASRI